MSMRLSPRGVHRRRMVVTRMSQRDDGDGDSTERVRRAQFRPPGERRCRGRGRAGASVGQGPSTMERQLVEEVYYFDLDEIWAEGEGKGSSSHIVLETPQFHMDLNEPTSGIHDVYFSLGGTLPYAYDVVDPFEPPHAAPQPPVEEPGEDEDDVSLVRRGRRVSHRTSCSTGGHIELPSDMQGREMCWVLM
ncbi:hypothetical protein PIB30_048001 [Stylosanthes scabra]|uniref:Uncharacterized protein n=1 Tax=Stylosanthes scabra TaxID=79078 RepID=A0ABU6UIU7_9FABA|nr:hypothetical protein [Stylosanthes scabra]